jgi:hypothetical protein
MVAPDICTNNLVYPALIGYLMRVTARIIYGIFILIITAAA